MNWATGERTGKVMKRPATSTRGGASLIAVMSIALLSMTSAAQAEADKSGEYSFGAWSVFCESGSCSSAYQYGRGGSRPTILRVSRGMGESPEILVEGGPFTPSGEVAFAIDGEFVSGGLASTLQAGSGDDLVLSPDDITYTLARRMRLGTTMVLTVPRAQGSETVEFDLDGFEEALRQVQKP